MYILEDIIDFSVFDNLGTRIVLLLIILVVILLNLKSYKKNIDSNEEKTPKITLAKLIAIAAIFYAIVVVYILSSYEWKKPELQKKSSKPPEVIDITESAIEKQNSQFEEYRGYKKGSSVNILLARVSSYVEFHSFEPDTIPAITIDKTKPEETLITYQANKLYGVTNTLINGSFSSYDIIVRPPANEEAEEEGVYRAKITSICNSLDKNHMYHVDFTYGRKGYIETIVIRYDAPNQ